MENILYLSEDNKVKLGDYTVALQIPADDFELKDNEGTKAFEAPECNTNESFFPRPLDIWALGISLYSYITGKLPFFAETDKEITDLIVNTVIDYSSLDISEEL